LAFLPGLEAGESGVLPEASFYSGASNDWPLRFLTPSGPA